MQTEEILRASARLIVNRAGLKTRYRAVQELVDALRAETARRMSA